MAEYKNAVCRGSWALGTACGKCERCKETPPPMRHQLFGKAKPPAPDPVDTPSVCQVCFTAHCTLIRAERDQALGRVKELASSAMDTCDQVIRLSDENQRLREALELVATRLREALERMVNLGTAGMTDTEVMMLLFKVARQALEGKAVTPS